MNKLLAILLIGNIALADVNKCDNALKACEEVIQAQDKAIDNLKKSVKIVREELENERSSTPRWMIFVGGVVAGVILSSFVNK